MSVLPFYSYSIKHEGKGNQSEFVIIFFVKYHGFCNFYLQIKGSLVWVGNTEFREINVPVSQTVTIPLPGSEIHGDIPQSHCVYFCFVLLTVTNYLTFT